MGWREDKIAEQVSLVAELTQKRELVSQQGRAAFQQKRRESDDSQKLVYEKQIEHFRNEHTSLTEAINQAEKILENYRKGIFDRPPADVMRRELRQAWKNYAYMIDNEKPEKYFTEIFQRLRKDQAALLIVQDGSRHMANLYWERIVKRVIHDQQDSLISVLDHEFTRSHPFTRESFLSQLGGRLIDNVTPDTELTVDSIVEALLNHADRGQIIPLRIDCHTVDSEVIQWFIESFWQKAVTNIANHFGVKLLTIIFVKKTIMGELSSHTISRDINEFNHQRLFEIQLESWTNDHIDIWFSDKTVINPLDQWQVKDQQLHVILQILQDQLDIIDGLPFSFYNALQGTIIDQVIEEITAV